MKALEDTEGNKQKKIEQYKEVQKLFPNLEEEKVEEGNDSSIMKVR